MRVRSVFIAASIVASSACGHHHDSEHGTPAPSPTPMAAVSPAQVMPSATVLGTPVAVSSAAASPTPAPADCPKSSLTFTLGTAKPQTTEMPETHAGLIGPGMPPKDVPATKPVYYVTLKNQESGRALTFQVPMPVVGTKYTLTKDSLATYEEPTFKLDTAKGATASGTVTFTHRAAPGEPVCGTFDLTISDAKHKVKTTGNFLAKERPPPPMMPMKGE